MKIQLCMISLALKTRAMGERNKTIKTLPRYVWDTNQQTV